MRTGPARTNMKTVLGGASVVCLLRAGEVVMVLNYSKDMLEIPVMTSSGIVGWLRPDELIELEE